MSSAALARSAVSACVTVVASFMTTAVLARGSVRACAEAVGVDTGWLAAVLATERASGVDGGEGLTSGVTTQAGSFPPIIVGRGAGCVVRPRGRSFPPIIVGRVAAFGTSLRGAEA